LQDSTLHARPLGSSSLRVLASPAYLKARGSPKTVADLARGHTLLGFTQPASLNHWPLRQADGGGLPVAPELLASSGETLRQLAVAGAGIVCLADFMTQADRAAGKLVQVLPRDTLDVRQPVHAVYYRNTRLSARIACFLDFMSARLPQDKFFKSQ
ncbi:MAG: LysR family transcriptional regulator, partial [Rhodoferax sp.]|nr:LysR family transcriptional regulator [Rhodoferax sp.]